MLWNRYFYGRVLRYRYFNGPVIFTELYTVHLHNRSTRKRLEQEGNQFIYNICYKCLHQSDIDVAYIFSLFLSLNIVHIR